MNGSRSAARSRRASALIVLASLIGMVSMHALAQQDLARFHDAPAATHQTPNPYAGKADAIGDGKTQCGTYCAACHGAAAQGNGNVPPLASAKVKNAPPGALFWFITHGDVSNGMPA